MRNALILSLFFLTACASVKDLTSASSCKVWKEEVLFGPTAVDVGSNGAYWDGLCKNLWWDCKQVHARSEENRFGKKEVYLNVSSDYGGISWDQDNKALGIIAGNEFNYNKENPLYKYISFTPLKVNEKEKTVGYIADIHILGMQSEVTYNFNSHCSNEQALLGALAVSAVGTLKNQKDK